MIHAVLYVMTFLLFLLYQSGIQPQPEGNLASQLVAMETGHVSVRLEVTPKRGSEQVLGDAVLTDELQIQVIWLPWRQVICHLVRRSLDRESRSQNRCYEMLI